MGESSLSQRVQKMTESATIAMSQRSREMTEKGLDVISLSIGQPDFDTPQIIKDAAKTAIDENYSKYTPVGGFLALRKAISEKLKRENNLDYNTNEISVSTGAKQAIINVILALLNPGDEVILPAPFWVSYMEQIKFAGGVPVILPTSIENDFKITTKALSESITNKTKLIIYSSPCNPSGSVYTTKELNDIANEVSQHENVFVLSDEIYEYINFTDQAVSIASFPIIKNKVITVNGVAKGFAMTGWRIGYAAGPQWLIKACNKIQGQFTSGANSIAQRACITALNMGQSLSFEMKTHFLRRRNLMHELLEDIPGIRVNKPKGAFYLFPDVSNYFGKSYDSTTINNADDLCEFILTDGLVALVSGDAFGSPSCIRISYASADEVLVEACARIKKSLSKLRS
ncbi:MAG: aspartate aminotransferase [Saprospiraceae bacterium]|jgi:aspartate aminotransferase